MITIRLLGGASIEGPDGPVTGPAAQRRRLALLALLAVDRSSAAARDRLLALLSPEADTERARHQLRDALYALRGALGAESILAAGDELRLDRAAVACDVWQMEAALDDGDLERGVDLYGGPFLDGFHLPDAPEFDAWVTRERTRLATRYEDALEALADAAAACDDHAAAVAWWRRRAALDPLNGRVALRLVTALHTAGDRAGALRHAGLHATLLREELGIEPDAAMRAWLEEAARQPVAIAAPARPADGPPAREPPRIEQATMSPPQRARPRRVLLAMIAAVAVLGALAPVLRRGGTGRESLDRGRVAVAAFQDRTGEPALRAVGSMAADWIIQGLAESGVVRVVPLITTLAASPATSPETGDSAPARALALATGSAIVVHGAYYLQAGRLHFQARISDAGSGTVLAALEPIDVPPDSALAAVVRLRESVLAALAPLLDARMAAVAGTTTRPPTYAAWQAWAEGLDHFVRGRFRTAIEHFEQAASADSTYPLPLLYTALSHWNLGDGARGDSIARRLASSGLRLAPLESALLASILAWGRSDWGAAYDAARRGADLAPGSGTAHAQVAVEARRLGRVRESADRLARLDPDRGDIAGFPFYWEDLADAHHLLGRRRAEDRAVRDALARHPDDPTVHRVELRALAGAGRLAALRQRLDMLSATPAGEAAAARTALEVALELRAHGHAAEAGPLLTRAIDGARNELAAAPEDARARARLVRALLATGETADALHTAAADPTGSLELAGLAAVAAARLGRADEAAASAARLPTTPARGGRAAYWRAARAAELGDADQARAALSAAFAEGLEFTRSLHVAPELDALRGSPGLRSLIEPRD